MGGNEVTNKEYLLYQPVGHTEKFRFYFRKTGGFAKGKQHNPIGV